MKKELNEVFDELTKNSSYDTYIDGFFGMGGSLKSLSGSLLKHGVKTVIVNDINPCIIKMHQNVRNNSIEMIDYFIETIRNEIVIPYGKLYVSAEDFIELKNKMVKRFYELQKKKSYGVEMSTLLIMISMFNYSGGLNIKNNGDIRFGNNIYQFRPITDFLYKTVKKINTFSELYNQFDMKFYNEDYFHLHKCLKYLPYTIWNIDTVYVKENYDKYIYEDMENLKNSDIRECKMNYGQSDFNHIGVLEGLKDIDFIYNNNTHPLMYHYKKKFSLNHKLFERNETMGSKKNENVKKVTEIILYANNFKQPINQSIENLPLEKCS
jgi:hypothetical protein